jgi:8-oxo-dGTP diphosphatase
MKHVDSVIVYIFNKNKNEVLMLERIKNSDFDWGFICGKFEKNETAEECLKREIFEELGLSNLNFEKLKKLEHKKDGETFYHHYFFTTIKKNTLINYQKKEIKSVKWFKLNELPTSRAPDDPKEALQYLTH